MIGLNAERYSVASISSAIWTRRPFRTASVTGSSVVTACLFLRRRCGAGFVALAERNHLRRADQLVDAVEIEHPIAIRLVRAVRGERAVEFAGHVAEGADDRSGKDDDRESDRLQFVRGQGRSLAA